jgi:hypothetical protein
VNLPFFYCYWVYIVFIGVVVDCWDYTWKLRHTQMNSAVMLINWCYQVARLFQSSQMVYTAFSNVLEVNNLVSFINNDYTNNTNQRPIFPPLPCNIQLLTQRQSPYTTTITMVHTSTTNMSTLQAGKFDKSDKCWTMRRHSVKRGKSHVNVARVQALSALHSQQFKEPHMAGLRW